MVRAAAPATHERVWRAGEHAVAIRTSDERKERRRDHRSAATTAKSASSRSARLSQEYVGTSSRAALESLAARPESASNRSMAPARASALPGGTSSASLPSVRISRIDGRSLATIGRPAAIYSKSFNGDVNRVEMADAVFGRTSTLACDSSS